MKIVGVRSLVDCHVYRIISVGTFRVLTDVNVRIVSQDTIDHFFTAIGTLYLSRITFFRSAWFVILVRIGIAIVIFGIIGPIRTVLDYFSFRLFFFFLDRVLRLLVVAFALGRVGFTLHATTPLYFRVDFRPLTFLLPL